MSFLFINKTLRLNNLKTRTAMNAKISILFFVLKRSYICYYMVCMTVPLKRFNVAKLLICYFLYRYSNQLHSSDSSNSIYNWHISSNPPGMLLGKGVRIQLIQLIVLRDGRVIKSQSGFILFLLLLYQIMQTMARYCRNKWR